MEQARVLLSQIEGLLSKGEIAFLTEKLMSKGIPIPKILVNKDHKNQTVMDTTQPVLSAPLPTSLQAFLKWAKKASRKSSRTTK
jgi:hypothetical protein